MPDDIDKILADTKKALDNADRNLDKALFMVNWLILPMISLTLLLLIIRVLLRCLK